METRMQNNPDGIGGIYSLIGTVILCFISRFTISDWSGIATIFAAVCTGGYYLYKTYLLHKNKNKNNASN